MLQQAKRLLGADPAAAVVLAQQALRDAPGSIEAQFVLGAAARRSGALAIARAALAPLAAAQPQAWGVQYEYGMVLAALSDCAGALAALERAVAANPRSSLAWHALGDQLALLGRDAAAVAAQARAVPGSVGDPALDAAAAAWFEGRDAGGTALRARFGIDLADVAAVRLLADIGVRQGRDPAVAALLQAAAAVAPDYLPLRFHHAVLLHRLDRQEEALAALDPVSCALPDLATARALRAAILMQLGREREAVEAYVAALAVAPDAAVWLGYGHALRSLGRQSEAVAAYRAALALRPGFGEGWWSLANLKTWRFEAGDVAQMRAQLAGEGLHGDDRAYLHFALGKALEDAADDAAAFAHYARANAARRATTPYDADAHAAFVRRSIATFTPAFFAARAGAGDPAPDPIFVLGMPRSGSTLVEQILASHSRVEGASELADLTMLARRVAAGPDDAYPSGLAALPIVDFAALGADYLARTRVRRPLGRVFFVDKFPGNWLHVGLLHLILPNARIIDVRRDPLACCTSLFKQSFARGQAYSYDLGDLGRTYVDYVTMMAHIDSVLPGRVLRLSYEALVADPERVVRDLLDYCGLDFEPTCLSFFETARPIRTPSSEQVRRPINRDGIDQWRRFAPWLGPLIAALGPLASEGAARP